MNTKKAKNNKWLTQTTLEESSERIFVKEVSGFGDLDTLFEEWTDEQKQQWEEQHPAENNNELTAEEALDIITGKE